MSIFVFFFFFCKFKLFSHDNVFTFRVNQTRLHKKSSFTIIGNKSPQSSRGQSPDYLSSREHTASSLIPSKTTTKPQLQRKSLSSTQLKLPYLSTSVTQQLELDDSPRPSVQFDMTGRHSPSKLPSQKGILQNKESLASIQHTLPTQLSRRRSSMLTTELDTLSHPPTKSCEALPFITDPYRTSIPRLHRSTLETGPETAVFPPGALPRPLKPNPNPTRKQKGLLKVLNHEEALSRIPLKSNWSSMDDLWLERKRKALLTPIQYKMNRRRSSSTSPSRRSSTQTTSDRRSSNLSTITTSDFSFRRPSTTAKPKTPQSQRRKSVFHIPSPTNNRRKSSSSTSIGPLNTQTRPSRTKIAKPTTLSPIIGTPNKDSSSAQSPLHSKRPPAPSSDSVSDTNSRRGSLSKIPIRSQANSRSNSRRGSQAGSRVASRSSSPMKENQTETNIAGLRSRSITPMEGRGSPLKDYEDAATRLSKIASGTGQRSRIGSPTRDYQDISGRSSRMTSRRSTTGSPNKSYGQIPTSRSTSRASQHITSQPGSRAQSRAPSQAPSRSTSRASTRPISLPGSRPTSRMEQATRSNSRLSIRSSKRAGSVSPLAGRKSPPTKPTTGRRKSVSLSPKGKRRSIKRRGSLSPVSRKTVMTGRSRSRSKSRTSPESSSRSLIPVSNMNGRSATKSPPVRKKATAGTDLRRTSSLKTKAKTPVKQPPSAKKLPTSVRKTESGVKQNTSAVSKQEALGKKQTTGIQKPSSVKREPSNVTKKAATRETTSLSIKKKTPATSGKTPLMSKKNDKDLRTEKRTAAKGNKGKLTKSEAKVIAATATVAAAVKGKEQQINNDTVVVSQKSDEKPQASNSGPTAATAMLAGMKRQPSTVSLMRVSSKISLLKKRSDSNISKNTLDMLVPEIETRDVEGKSLGSICTLSIHFIN